MCSFENLSKILSQESGPEKKLDFSELKEIMCELPPESDFRSWWDNDGISEQSKAWLNNQFRVKKVVPELYVEFEKIPFAGVHEKIDSNCVFDEIIEDVNEDTVFNITSSKVKSTSTSDDKDGLKVAGWLILFMDLIIGIPIFIFYVGKTEIESATTVFVIGFIIFIIAFIFLFIAYPGGGGYGYSGYDRLYHNMKNHNRSVEQMLMDNENHRLQEQMYRLTHESEPPVENEINKFF